VAASQARALWVGAATLASALTLGASFAFGAPVDPATFSATVTSGSSVDVTKTVHTPAIPAEGGHLLPRGHDRSTPIDSGPVVNSFGP
jgi:hypothetical protein